MLLGTDSDIDESWLEPVIGSSRPSLIKLTRAVPEQAAENLPTRQTLARWIVVRNPSPAREILPLASTDEATLANLGRHTRRNLRAARKHAAAFGFSFEVYARKSLLTDVERAELAGKTKPLGLRISEITRFEAYVDRTGRPFRSVVRDADGTIISYCCGYLGTPNAAYLLYQLNNSTYHPIGPALLHRSLLLPWLIGQGCKEIVFVHGCIGVLAHACLPQHLEEVWFMRRSIRAYCYAALIRLAKPGAPIGHLARLALSGTVLPKRARGS